MSKSTKSPKTQDLPSSNNSLTMPEFAYCVSCNAGVESSLKRDLETLLPFATVYYPMFDREERKNGQWSVKTYPLIPGYLFIYSPTPIPSDLIYRSRNVNRLLGYDSAKTTQPQKATNALADTDIPPSANCNLTKEQDSYSLYGADRDFASWIYKHSGHIKLSRAMLIGDKTKIIDGPLLDYEGEILKINRQRRSALVCVKVGTMTTKVWLSFHWMSVQDGIMVDWQQ